MLVNLASTLNLLCAEWGAAVKTSLLIIVLAVLFVVLALLVLEIIGKRNYSDVSRSEQLSKSDDAVLSADDDDEEDEYDEDEDGEESDETDPDQDEQFDESALDENDDGEIDVEFGLDAEKAVLRDELAELDDEQELIDEEEEAENIALVDATLLEEEDDNAPTGVMVFGSSRIEIRYIRSFKALLIQSDDDLKGMYNELRNELMRYQLSQRVSWSNESWYNKRVTYAKFGIRGKSLYLYLALSPKDYAGTKYNFRDVSSTQKYADVPMRLKIKSQRSVTWAKELIAAVGKAANLERSNAPSQNFRPDWQDTKSLVREKLIKIRYVASPDKSKQDLESAATADLKLKDRAPRDFSTKLMRADRQTKARYSGVKNELLRYGMKPRMSKTCESWYIGRTTYAKFTIRGKTLTLYMALDPKEFENTKYNFADVGDVNKYESVPMRLNLRSDRSVKWVKELIAVMAQQKGWTRQELSETDFRYVSGKKTARKSLVKKQTDVVSSDENEVISSNDVEVVLSDDTEGARDDTTATTEIKDVGADDI